MCAAPYGRIPAGPGAGMARRPPVRPGQSGAVILLAYLLRAV